MVIVNDVDKYGELIREGFKKRNWGKKIYPLLRLFLQLVVLFQSSYCAVQKLTDLINIGCSIMTAKEYALIARARKQPLN